MWSAAGWRHRASGAITASSSECGAGSFSAWCRPSGAPSATRSIRTRSGSSIIDPTQRGQGLGFQALSLLLAYLFDERGALRVWFSTDEDNGAMRRLGEGLGFRLEGIMRGGREVEGRLIDEALYGITRDDPRAPLVPGPAA